MQSTVEQAGVFHLIYSSSATERLSQEQLRALLSTSRANNEACGLTGMLLYRDGLYLQFIEGPRDGVVALLTRIRQDSRHMNLKVIRQGILPHRLFPDWSMAYKSLAGVRSTHVPGYSDRLQKSDRQAVDGDPAELLMRMFYERLQSAA